MRQLLDISLRYSVLTLENSEIAPFYSLIPVEQILLMLANENAIHRVCNIRFASSTDIY